MRQFFAAAIVVLPMMLGAMPNAVQADVDDTFEPYVRALYGYDSNLFRLENDQAALAALGTTDTAETYHALAAGLDMNWRISRQVIVAHAEFNQMRYDKYSRLNYNGHDIALKWNWLVGSTAAGDVGMEESLTQGSFVDIKQPVSNLLKTRKSFFNGALGVSGPWQFKLGLDSMRSRNAAAIQQSLDSTVDTVKAGVQYETAKGTEIEWLTQHASGKYPTPQTVGSAPVRNSYHQWDSGVRVKWAPTEKTQLAGRLNYTERSYREVPQRNFSGVTGRLALDYLATDKTTLQSSLYREIGAVTYPTASYAVIEGATLGANWKPSEKITSHLLVGQDRIDYAGDPGLALTNATPRQDRHRSLQAGLSYQVLRNTSLGFVLKHGVAHSNQALMSYSYNSALFNLRSEF